MFVAELVTLGVTVPETFDLTCSEVVLLRLNRALDIPSEAEWVGEGVGALMGLAKTSVFKYEVSISAEEERDDDMGGDETGTLGDRAVVATALEVLGVFDDPLRG